MNARRVAYLMGTTFLWGGLSGLIVGFLLSFQDPALKTWNVGDWIFGFIGWLGGGLIFSALSLLGFFAFSLIHQFGLGFLRRPFLWNGVLLILVALTFYDMVEIRYANFATEGESYFSYMIMPALFFIWAFIIAFIKMKDTNKLAFIPALFFMFSFTIIELFPALRQNNMKSLLDMAIPLVVVNSWQILTFHRIIANPKLERTVQKADHLESAVKGK